MPLSKQTIDEMKAGMKQVAVNEGHTDIDPAYMSALVRTGRRASWLKSLEKDGKIRIEKVLRSQTSGVKTFGDTMAYVVYVGDNVFEDINGQMLGQWPSEVLVAQVALALGAGEHLLRGATESGDI